MYAEGNQLHIYAGIFGQWNPKREIYKADKYYEFNGISHKKKTKVIWDMEVKWKDRSNSWLTLNKLKKYNLNNVAYYAVDNRIDLETAYYCWARYALKRSRKIISK